ncbi:hypothetical protein PoB_002379600 [Plakobranchus ocellatus]|uniref:Uncharacterized protein n=1 Tax=Plakobranchus ocellatus TaxID=259542 RepID=A0AAV3ZMU8_9GAST|nr:hypothetical protein PoB_002379600 [Plakobranchus ocellatus]
MAWLSELSGNKPAVPADDSSGTTVSARVYSGTQPGLSRPLRRGHKGEWANVTGTIFAWPSPDPAHSLPVWQHHYT